MNVEITDSEGARLIITSDIHAGEFDAIACSPHPDGFTVLHGTVGDRMPRDQLELACRQSVERGEVCVLPGNASPVGRVMIVPNAGALNAMGRQRAAVLMLDLVHAARALAVGASSLRISHFGYVPRYPQPHVLGICDAINELKRRSFLGLRVLGFDVAPKIQLRFDQDVWQALSVN